VIPVGSKAILSDFIQSLSILSDSSWGANSVSESFHSESFHFEWFQSGPKVILSLSILRLSILSLSILGDSILSDSSFSENNFLSDSILRLTILGDSILSDSSFWEKSFLSDSILSDSTHSSGSPVGLKGPEKFAITNYCVFGRRQVFLVVISTLLCHSTHASNHFLVRFGTMSSQ
jgi:hypothetical protein